MKVYADSGPRLVVQLAADFAVVCWLVTWVWLGTVVHDGIEVLADPGERISAAADDLSGSLLLDATAADRVLARGPGGDEGGDLELFAWRAVTTLPLHRVVRVSDDPVGAIRRGDADVVRRLAELELARIGVAPRGPNTPGGLGGPDAVRVPS